MSVGALAKRETEELCTCCTSASDGQGVHTDRARTGRVALDFSGKLVGTREFLKGACFGHRSGYMDWYVQTGLRRSTDCS